MKVAFPLAGLVLLLGFPLEAADFIGADAVLRQAATEQAKAPVVPKLTESEALRAQLEAFSTRALTIAPDAAAKEWDEMFEGYLALSHESDQDRGWTPLFFASLPPSASWDSLGKHRDLPFMQMGWLSVLRGTLCDDPKDLEYGLEQLRQDAQFRSPLRAHNAEGLRYAMSFSIQEKKGRQDPLVEFEKDLTGREAPKSEQHPYINPPDLVMIVGPEKAAQLLRRALRLETRLANIGGETRRLAARLALESIDKLRQPQWDLVRTPEDGPLYEALAKRFPAEPLKERGVESTANYILYLAGQGRGADASRLVEEAHEQFPRLIEEINDCVVIHPGQRDFDRRVRDFFHDELSRHPERLDWKCYVDLSVHLGEPGPMLDFLAQALTQPPPFFGTPRWKIHELYARALLAEDRLDDGLRELTAVIREHPWIERAEAQAELPEPPKRPLVVGTRDSSLDADINNCLRLARIGRLMEREDCVNTGTTAALILQQRATHGNMDTTIRVADFLAGIGRGPDAERLLVEEQFNLPLGDDSWLGDMCAELAQLYSRAGRHADVLKLLESSPYWYRADLSEYDWTGHISPLLLVAAKALAATGKKEEARRAVTCFLQRQLDCDPAYELLLQLGGNLLEEQLDALARRDRFEKRPLIWKARWQLDQGRLAEAEKTARAAITMDPSDGAAPAGDRLRAYAVLGDILAKKGDTAEADKMRRIVAAVRLAEQAEAWQAVGLTTRAARVYEQALEKYADVYCIQSRLALCYSELGDDAQAELHYRRAFELMPASCGRIATQCFESERVFPDERAKIVADRVLAAAAAREPLNPRAQFLLGTIREEQGQYVQAGEQYRKAVKLDPDYLGAWQRLRSLDPYLPLSPKEREQVELTLLRLDPGLLHHEAEFRPMQDLRSLWDAILAAEKASPPRWTGPACPLPAAAAELARQQQGRAAAITPEALLQPLRVEWTRIPILEALAKYLEEIEFRP